MHKLGKRKDESVHAHGKQKPGRYLNWRDMPYEGCGPMYEYPHYCPVHLFSATSFPEIPGDQPLNVALMEALKLKFEKLKSECEQQEEEQEQQEDNDKKEETTGLSNCKDIDDKAKEETADIVKWIAIPRKTFHIPLSAKGDNSLTKQNGDRRGKGQCSKEQARSNKQKDVIRVPHFRAGVSND